MERNSGNFGDILLRDGLITNSQLEEAIKRRQKTGKPLGRIMVELGFISERDKLTTLKRRFGCEIISIGNENIPPAILGYIPKSFASKNYAVPVRLDSDGLVVAMEDPTDLVTVDNLKNIVGINVKAVGAPSSEIEDLIKRLPETAEPVIVIEKPLPMWFRAIRYSTFPILCFIPIPALIGLCSISNKLLNMIMKSDKFDLFLYILIGWGLWAIILYEINGLIFGEDQKKSSKKNKEDEI